MPSPADEVIAATGVKPIAIPGERARREAIGDDLTQARVAQALKVGAETYEGELEMGFLSRLAPTG